MTSPIGPPPVPTDRIGTEIKIGEPIAYAVSDGYLSVGVVRDIIHDIKERYDHGTQTRTPYWTTRLKVEVINENSKYRKTQRHVSLTKLSNVIVLRGPEAEQMTKRIAESWVDKGL